MIKALLNLQSFRFTFIAVLGLVIDFGVAYTLTTWFGIYITVAAAIGFSLGALFNYILHELWTFTDGERKLSARRAFRYLLVVLLTLLVRLLSLELLLLFIDKDNNEHILLLGATILSFFFNYLASKFLVFKASNKNLNDTSSYISNETLDNMQNSETKIDDAEWSVPSFTESVYFTKKHDYALVIPVINEGTRIQNQLKNILAAGLSVDVVIADGGSTDDSLNETFLRSVNVRTLLTKMDEGKLSAQLRIAYAWCLKEHYKGILTIDGNGKDSVESVSAFVEKLQEGYDYVQGSRYKKGGKAENTPLERTIGNRCIHAPMLSLAGHFWFTDTTNGFRGYSAQYLLDKRVLPFRDVFMNYELLFYLTTRAGQLGYNVCEVPVRRSYPIGEATPTKINSSGAKLALFKQTLSAAMGNFKP